MVKALLGFWDEAEKGNWVLIYCAGHGIEIGSVNYLIPVDAKLLWPIPIVVKVHPQLID